MLSETLKEEKQKSRRDMLEKRRSLSAAQVVAWNKQIAEYFCSWPMYHSCETVMFYLAMPDEAQTDLLINDALMRGKRVCVPLLGKNYGEMSATEITSLDDLVIGKYGLKMPTPDKIKIVLPVSINMVVVPAAAFGKDGNRLGMGAGYYDRFLPKTKDSVLLGLAWGCQLVDKIPSEKHDVRMQHLLTEDGFIVCSPR